MGFLDFDIIKTFLDVFRVLNIKCYLVGGAVRDILMGIDPIDFDFVCELDEEEHYIVATKISDILKCDFKYNSFYRTAKFFYKEFDVDFVMARSEKYLSAASKPIIKPAGIVEDLKRRDFTINSIAVSLKDEKFQIIDPFNGIEDIKNRKLKILHEKSFKDDPTRIFRGIKYASRFGFDFEVETKKAIEEALQKGYVLKLPKGRIRLEIEGLLNDKNPLSALRFLKGYGILESVLKSDVYIYLEYDKIKFSQLCFNEKMVLIFYKNQNEVLKGLKDFLCLGENFIKDSIKIKDLESSLLESDFEVYKYLFRENIKYSLLKAVYYKDKRVQNYLKYNNTIKIDIKDAIDLPPDIRKECIASNKANMLIKLLNGGQDYV
ncbi:MAG: hypothetical protein N2448_05285 [Caloramator sp.]|nr:hypothetical protein [Caloramator sp.]